MKKLLLILLVLSFFGCKKEEIKPYDPLIVGFTADFYDQNDGSIYYMFNNNCSGYDSLMWFYKYRDRTEKTYNEEDKFIQAFLREDGDCLVTVKGYFEGNYKKQSIEFDIN